VRHSRSAAPTRRCATTAVARASLGGRRQRIDPLRQGLRRIRGGEGGGWGGCVRKGLGCCAARLGFRVNHDLGLTRTLLFKKRRVCLAWRAAPAGGDITPGAAQGLGGGGGVCARRVGQPTQRAAHHTARSNIEARQNTFRPASSTDSSRQHTPHSHSGHD